MFLVVLSWSGPKWDTLLPLEDQWQWNQHALFMDTLVDDGFLVLGGPLADEMHVAHDIETESEETVRETLALDPWYESLLRIDSVDAWTIRLDGRPVRPRLRTCNQRTFTPLPSNSPAPSPLR